MTTPPEGDAAREVQLGIDLRERAERLIRAAEAFAQAAQTFRKIAVWAAAFGAVVLLGIGSVLVAVFVTLHATQASLDSGRGVRDQLIDCVQPGGNCYERSQQQTGEVVSALVAAIDQDGIVRAACAQNEADVAEPIGARISAIDACVQAHLPK